MTLPNWVTNWISPAGLMVVMGGVIWGIQLNAIVLMHSERLAEIKTDMAAHELRDLEWGKTLGHTVVLLAELEKRVESNTRHAEEHEKEAANWKYKIIELESKINE